MVTLLGRGKIVNLPATTELFVVAEKFVVNLNPPQGSPKISYVGNDFKENFYGVVEPAHCATKLRYAPLSRASLDAPIMKKLGGSAWTQLAFIYALMCLQPNGEVCQVPISLDTYSR